jgi:hypothetical protein
MNLNQINNLSELIIEWIFYYQCAQETCYEKDLCTNMLNQEYVRPRLQWDNLQR